MNTNPESQSGAKDEVSAEAPVLHAPVTKDTPLDLENLAPPVPPVVAAEAAVKPPEVNVPAAPAQTSDDVAEAAEADEDADAEPEAEAPVLPTTILRKGAMGAERVLLMQLLGLRATHFYDDEVVEMVKAIQENHNLPVTGCVDQFTWQAIANSAEG